MAIPGFETAQWLGLLADRVVDTLQVTPEMLATIGIGESQAPYLGDAIIQDQNLIRCFEPTGIDLRAPNKVDHHVASVG
jgi:hypothetical protein